MPRHRFDPLARRDLPHWLTVADLWGVKVRCDPVTHGADHHGVMKAAIANLTAEGWQAESDGRYGFLFVSRDGERRLVNLTPVDPGAPLGAGHACLAGHMRVLLDSVP